MIDHTPMEARWVDLTPDEDGHITSYSVGNLIWFNHDNQRITRITVQQDLPGLHCNMRRVCVWTGDDLAFEAPVHAVAGIGYVQSQGGQGND